MSLTLSDRSGTILGEIVVLSENALVLGTLLPTAAFAAYATLFKNLEQAANDQLFVEADRLEQEIQSCDFCVLDTHSGMQRNIADLQIMQDGICFHWRASWERPG